MTQSVIDARISDKNLHKSNIVTRNLGQSPTWVRLAL